MLHDPKFGGQGIYDNQSCRAAETFLPGQTIDDTHLTFAGQTPFGGQQTVDTQLVYAPDTELPGHFGRDLQTSSAGQPELADHRDHDIQRANVGQTDQAANIEKASVDGLPPVPDSDEGQARFATQSHRVLVGTIVAEARRYEDYTRARQRLLLQAMATCRSFCGGDKAAGAKLYKKQTPEIAAWLAPYEAAMAPLDAVIADQKKVLEKLAKQLPVWKYCEGVGGVGPYMLARIVGAAGRSIDEYRSPAALWKRFMLAVDDGKRQWKDASPAARAIVWNVGECILKAQVRNPKGEDGKPTGDRFAIGPLGQIYIDRRAIEATKVETDGHIHNRSKRYMEKRFLRDLWRAWRAAA